MEKEQGKVGRVEQVLLCLSCKLSNDIPFRIKRRYPPGCKILLDNLGCHNGGLIGYVEEYRSIGMSDENYQHCIDAFRELGKYDCRT